MLGSRLNAGMLRLLRPLACCLIAALFFPACLDDFSQSAVQPGLELAPTPTAAPRPTLAPLRRSTPVSVPTRRRVYFTRGGDLWQLPVDSPAAPVVTNRSILAFAASPDGSQVALAVQDAQDQDQEQFEIINADSSVARQLNPVDQAGTPVPAGGAVDAIAWAPRGDQLAVARDDGSVSLLGLDGSARTLVPARPGSHPGELAWSPDGQTLAYLDPAQRDQPTGLFIVPASGGSARSLLESGGIDNSVLAAVWIDTNNLAVIQGKPGDVAHGGDLFQVDATSGRVTLLVSSGRFAPVAGVFGLAVSENGQRLAFTVYVPGDRQPRFQGLWLLDLNTREVTQVTTAANEDVTDLWWASGVLLYRSIREADSTVPGAYTGTEQFALYQFDPATRGPVERYRATSA